MCHSASSHSAATGVVENPVAKGYSSGGSSSGSGVLVALGEVDMAIGADQGGSIRVPAAHCGIVGLVSITQSSEAYIELKGCRSQHLASCHTLLAARMNQQTTMQAQ